MKLRKLQVGFRGAAPTMSVRLMVHLSSVQKATFQITAGKEISVKVLFLQPTVLVNERKPREQTRRASHVSVV